MDDAQQPDLVESPPPVAAPAKRERVNRPFPTGSFEEAEEFARQIHEFASGKPVRRILLFNHMNKSPESSASRVQISNANRYGLVKGSYKTEQLELTADAQSLFGERTSPKDRARLKAKLAIDSVPLFASLYEKFQDLKLPARAALVDAARELMTAPEVVEEGVDLFLVNLKFVGLLQTLSGAERIVSVDHMLDVIPQTSLKGMVPTETVTESVAAINSPADLDNVCFYVTPIGEEGSEFRKHSDLFLNHLVEPALEQFGLKVIRADRIGEPGVISKQIFDMLVRARLVVVDLSFHNPNVFYELAVRHVLRKPVVQITRVADKVPFDLNQMRTITIDNTDIYSLLPKLEVYRSEIATQVRTVLDGGSDAGNPISTYYPTLEVRQ